MTKISYPQVGSPATRHLPVPVAAKKTATEENEANGITFSGLDPVLGSLGVLIGLLTQPVAGVNTYTLNPHWFANPINNTQEGITNNPEQFEKLLAEILGKIGGNALGIPIQDASLLGTWYPIKNGETPTGFYMVSYPKTTGSTTETVMGLGILHTWGVPPTNPLLKVNVWGLLPFVRIGNGAFKMTFDTPGYPVSIGIAAEGGVKDHPLVDINGLSFDGVKFSAMVDLPAPDPFNVSLEVLSLKLPGEIKAANRSLADLLAITGEEVLEMASSLFVGALSHIFPGQDKRIQYLTPLFGLSSTVPDLPGVKMPLLPWYDLFKVAATNPQGLKTLFFDWFNSISADPAILKGWITTISGFLGNTQLAITGTGTRLDPYNIQILSVDAIGKLSFTVATDVVDSGIRYFFPGLSLKGNNIILGTSDAAFTIQADLELGKFGLSPLAVSASPEINFTFQFALNNKTAGQPLIAYDGYSFGSLSSGLQLGTNGKIVPHFSLNQVVTPQSSFESVNLLSPGELADTGAAVLSAALSTLIGVGHASFSDNIAALIGLIPPGSAANWPADLAPPFSPTEMVHSILNPISAWANYYLKTLKYQPVVDGKAAFAFIVQELALLLQNTTAGLVVNVDGDGTPTSPWRAGIALKSASLPAYITAYRQEPEGGGVTLVMGISLMPVITIAGVEIVPSLDLEAISLTFPPDNGLEVTAGWLPQVAAKLTLPQGYTTPAFAGVVVSVSKSQLSAGWSRDTGWGWSMYVNAPKLIVDGQNIILGQDLNFSNQSALEDLVKQSAATFTPFLIAALGTSLIRTETRAGLFTTGVLGLLPDISKSPVFPSGLAWNGFTQLSISSLSDPWPDLRNHLASNFATAATSKSLLSLLSYTISPTITAAPTINGTGTFEEPYMTPLPGGFELPVWFEPASKILGLGAGRTDSWKYQQTVNKAIVKFNFDLTTRVNGLKYNLTTGNLIIDSQVPSLSFLGTLYNPDGLLVNLPGLIGTLEKVVLGFNLAIVDGTLKFVPVVNLEGVTLPGQEAQALITLEDFLSVDYHAAMQSAFLAMLNAAIQTAIAQVKEKALFQSAYELLTMLGLCLDRQEVRGEHGQVLSAGSDIYGISTAGWNGLLANFDTYIQTQLNKLLSIPAERTKLFSFLEQLLDIQIPTFDTPVLELLAGLNICGPADLGYPIYPDAILELASNPITALQSRFQWLFEIDHVEELKKLTAELAMNIAPVKFGHFTFSTDANGVITFAVLPEDAFALGSFLNISGGIQLDISNQQLKGALNLYCEKVGITLQNELTLKYKDGQLQTTFECAALWGDGSKPSATPLQLIPFNTTNFLNQVADIAPAYSLNILLNAVFEEQLLKKYPLIQQIFSGLGLAVDITGTKRNQEGFLVELDGNGLWQMPSLMGVLRDPLGWLLSDDVLGYNGKFNVAALARLLSNLPASSANGINLTPVTNGVDITGLPYGFEVGMSGTAGMASFRFETKDITISEDWGILNSLSFVIGLDELYQPAFSGGLVLSSGSKISPAFYVNTGFDKNFYLKISQGAVGSPSGLSVQLLPFLGWGTLAEQAARLAAAALLNNLVPTLLQKLSDSGAKEFVDKLKSFGTLVDVTDLVNKILGVLTPVSFAANNQKDLLDDVEAVALAWLQGRFTTATAGNTVDAMIVLLSGLVPGLSKQGNRLAFKPSDQLPITILAGLNSSEFLGLWVDLTLPGTQLLKVEVAETGVGVKLDGTLQFSFGAKLVVPIDGNTGPSIGFSYDPNSIFVLNFDPLGDAVSNTPSDLSRTLLPTFFPARAGDSPDLSTRVTSWLLDVIKLVLPRYVSVLILNIDTVKTWLETPIVASPPTGVPTPAIILEAVSLIQKRAGGQYVLNTVDNLTKLTPAGFFGNLLLTLMQHELTLLTFGTDNKAKITIGPKKGSQGFYGVRVVAPDLKLLALPNLVLQLGDSATGADEWILQSGGVVGDPGVGFYLPIKSDNGDVSVDFTFFSLLFYNLGFDFVGLNGKPIVDLARFKIKKIKPRTVFGLDFKGNASPQVNFGAGVTLQDIGLSLAPNQLAGNGSTNPIASNILGSGSSSSNGNPPSDPTFSVTTAYSNKLWVNLQSNTGNGNEVILPVQRSFGPLYVDSIGLGWEDAKKLLDFIFSGNVELAGLKTTVIGLRVGVPVTDPTNFSAYNVDLDGLDISFKGGAVEISGGFLKTEITDGGDSYISYTGVAVIKAGTFSLMALGSYAEVPVSTTPGAEKVPSLFIFAVLTAPLGGIPAFFITGIAAGFSFNRSIEIPPITEVQNFPLLKGLVSGTFADGEDPGKALLELSSVVKPEVGQYWLAAGIKFTSFELITSSSLLFLSFGKEWEVNLLGLSFASLPPKIPRQFALAYFELAIKVSFKPEQGIISAEAQLTPNSFVLSKDCKVTGGFAFFLWYKNIVTDKYVIPAGDFVISLGGYHPNFNKPVYYPEVPRLGMQWKMDISVGSISISGGAYFALCPTAVMAGGYINVAYQLGPLKAWLNAYANFLIEWKPFYFNVGIGITVGASFGTTILGVSITLKAELGARLQLEGPPTHGSVHVDWFVISFTIPIGSDNTATSDNNLTWRQFSESFLPPPADESGTAGKSAVAAVNMVQQVVKWNPETGLLNSVDDLWTIQPYPFSFSVKSAIPASLLTVTDSGFNPGGIKVGVRPMGYINDLNAPLTITVKDSKGVTVNLGSRRIKMKADQNGAPGALWSKDALNRDQAPNPDTMLIANASFGILFDADEFIPIGDIAPFDILNLEFDLGNRKLLPYKNVAKYPPAARYPASDQNTAYHVIMQSVMRADTIIERNKIYTALQLGSMEAPLNPDLSVMASSANFILQALPVIARIGIYQNNGVMEAPHAAAFKAMRYVKKEAVHEVKQPKLQGILKRYKVSRATTESAALSAVENTVKGAWKKAGSLTRKGKFMGHSLAAEANNSKTIYDGTVVLWKVDELAATTLQLQGALPVRITSFDAHGALLSFKYTNGETAVDLPETTAQVAVQGYEAGLGVMTGWQENTPLAKVNGVWALSDAAMIRVQNSQRIRVRTDHSNQGIIDTVDLLGKNKVLGSGDVKKNGWIQSVFPGATKYIGVQVNNADGEKAALAVTIEANVVPLNSGLSKAAKVIKMDDSTLFVFACSTAPAEYFGVVATSDNPDTRVTAMYGFDELPADVRSTLSGMSLNNAGLDLSAENVVSTTVSIQSKTLTHERKL